MKAERLQMKGMLCELERETKQLDAKCKGHLLLVRQILNPYEDDLTKLDISEAKAAMDSLAEDSNKLEELKKKMQRIRDDLG